MRTFQLSELEGISAEKDVLRSPLSLRGNQDKWYYQKERLVVKAALFDGFVRWEDWKVEALASQMLPLFGIQVLRQEPCLLDDGYGNIIYGCYSEDYRAVRERYYTFGRLLINYGGEKMTELFTSLPTPEKIETVSRIIGQYIGQPDAERFVEDMCLADYILGNPDRHYDNYGILIRRDNADQVVSKRPAPLYDFGMGLFQGQREDDLDAAIEARPESPFAFRLAGAFDFFKEKWLRRCEGIQIDLSQYDFPSGLGKQYLRYSLGTLGVKTEGN